VVTPGRDLLHVRTRNAFRDACCDLAVVRRVETAFENEGFYPASEAEGPPEGWYGRGGERRGTFDRHTHGVDWTDPEPVRRVVAVFEEILSWATGEEYRQKLIGYLRRDGYNVDESGRVTSSSMIRLAELPLENLRDPSAITEHLDRISRAAESDPALAISASKALIEATTKMVLSELGEAYDEKAEIPALVRATQKALGLHPESIAPTAKGVESIRRILSNLSQVAVGVAELRNEYGTDHGRTRAVGGLGARHAHLAVGCASTYCRLLIETLDARRE
jgi:hypothetical protein